MKIHILQENLIKALNKTNRILSSKAQIPILQNVLLKSDNGLLKIITTNLEISMITRLGGKIEQEGDVCVSSKLLLDLVSCLPQEVVSMETKGEELYVSTSRTRSKLSTIHSSEFPDIKTGKKEKSVEMESSLITGVLGNVLFSAATDEGRPVLTGIKITSKGSKLIFAATDGYRLSVKDIDFETGKDLDIIVPARAMAELIKVIGEEKKEEKTAVLNKTSENQLEMGTEDTQILARLIDGEYPDYRKIIPKNHTTRAVFDKNEFARAVKSASIFARDNANIIKLNIQEGLMNVSANSPQTGSSNIEIDIKKEGDDSSIAFNSRFLADFLSNVSGESLVFEMTGSLNPGLFRTDGDDSFLHIIMPVRVQG